MRHHVKTVSLLEPSDRRQKPKKQRAFVYIYLSAIYVFFSLTHLHIPLFNAFGVSVVCFRLRFIYCPPELGDCITFCSTTHISLDTVMIGKDSATALSYCGNDSLSSHDHISSLVYAAKRKEKHGRDGS